MKYTQKIQTQNAMPKYVSWGLTALSAQIRYIVPPLRIRSIIVWI